jgi:CHAT domain-containing protein
VSNEKFDILHFSGHSITLPDNGGTFLIFPDKSGVGRGVSMRVVADWVREAGIRMVLLSSCSSSSLRTAIELMRTKADAVIGFRWDVNDHACVEYFENFYRMYVKQRKSIAEAYCGACRKVRMSSHGLPIWASAIAVVKD